MLHNVILLLLLHLQGLGGDELLATILQVGGGGRVSQSVGLMHPLSPPEHLPL